MFWARCVRIVHYCTVYYYRVGKLKYQDCMTLNTAKTEQQQQQQELNTGCLTGSIIYTRENKYNTPQTFLLRKLSYSASVPG